MTRATLAILALLLLLLPASAVAADFPDGRIGPDLHMTGNGRALAPAGRLTPLGNFPTGAVLTPDGRYLWAVDSGHAADDVKVVDVATGGVVQTLPLPGAYGAAAFSADGRHAYVSGESKGSSTPSGPTKGDAGDVVHVFDVDPGSGHAVEQDPIAMPSSSDGTAQRNSFPPVNAVWPQGLSVSPDGKTLAVALNQADRVAFVDLGSRAVRTVKVGTYPFAAIFAGDARTAYVSNEGDGTISVVDVATGRQTTTVDVGGAYSHPEAMAVDPSRDRLYVAVTNRDRLAAVDLAKNKVAWTVDVGRSEAPGTQPVAVGLSPDGAVAFTANSNEDALAVVATGVKPNETPGRAGTAGAQSHSVVRARRPTTLRRLLGHRRSNTITKKMRGPLVKACGGPSRKAEQRYLRTAVRAIRRHQLRSAQRAYSRLAKIRSCGASTPGTGPGIGLGGGTPRVIGRIPTGAYPTAALVTPDARRIVWVAGKGFGAGPNPGYRFDIVKPTTTAPPVEANTYVLDKLQGLAGVADVPSAAALSTLTSRAERQTVPANRPAEPPAGTPLRKDGPIKHVFYIVRENRTYDQIFGSDPRGDGDPSLELFGDNNVPGATGGVTPNAHALARRFPLLDHVYANSEVSVDGHLITAGSIAIDYAQRATAANYSNRGRAYDFGVWPITFGPRHFVFDQAAGQGVSFSNYGELASGVLPPGNDGRSTYAASAAALNPTYPNNIQIGCTGAGTPATCYRDSSATGPAGAPAVGATSRYDVFNTQFQAQLTSGNVPAFNYLILPNDHTNGTTAGVPTPKADIADNDLGLGQLVDTISHSSIWSSSAIIVVEDDSQDGADHVDAHRMPAFVISPWASTDGRAVHTRYDQYSALRTAEILAGLDPLSVNDALATPMYDAFRTDGAPDNAPYSAITPQQSLTELNPSGTPSAALAAKLPLNRLDLVPQAVLDGMLWHSVHGEASRPPRPGPHASRAEHQRALTTMRIIRSGGNAKAYLRRTGGGADG